MLKLKKKIRRLKVNAGRWSLAFSCKYGNERSGCSIQVGGNVKKAQAQNTFECEQCMRPGTFCQLWRTITKLNVSLNRLKTQTQTSIFFQLPDGLSHIFIQTQSYRVIWMTLGAQRNSLDGRPIHRKTYIHRHNAIQHNMDVQPSRNIGSVVQSQCPYSPRTVSH